MNEIFDAANEQPAHPSLTPIPAESRYKGVGGWLLFLCLALTVFSPFMTLASLAAGYTETSKYFDLFPGLLAITIVDTFLSLGLMVFSIYAGAGLWSVRAGAVRLAKRYLLCFLGYHVIAAALPFMAGLPSEAHEAMIPEVAKEALKGIIFFIVWYSYLNGSKRVRATFRECYTVEEVHYSESGECTCPLCRKELVLDQEEKSAGNASCPECGQHFRVGPKAGTIPDPGPV